MKVEIDRGVVETHADAGTDSNEAVQLGANLVSLTATVTDNDGDTASASIDLGPQISIHDDGPVITSVTSGLATFNVDESAIPVIGSGQAPLGTQTDTHSFSGDFNVVTAGADGEQSLAYALTITHATTNLVDSITGQTVTLVQNGSNEVDGVVTISGQQVDVFKLTVDSSGDVKVEIDRGVVETHADAGTDSNEAVQLGANLVSLTATVTDNDGDTASASIDLGPQISIHDDGPLGPTVTLGTAVVGVDETPGPQTTGGATDVLGSTMVTFNGVSEHVADIFATVANKGVDTDVPSLSLDNGALSFASTGTSGIVSVGTLTFGADGPAASGAEKVALTVTNTSSGLTLTDGTAITLSVDASGRVIGTVGTDAANPTLSGKTAFAIALDPATGELYVAQYLSLHQDSLSNTPNDAVTLASGTVGVKVTLTDGDGDTASTTTDISSHVSFLDDGPTIGTTLNAVLASVNGSDVQGTWQPTFGADGPSATSAIGIAIPNATINGTTYAVSDTGTHNAAGDEVFQIAVAGTSNYTFFETTHYTPGTQTDELFAYATLAGAQAGLSNDEFFTLTLAANGTYNFDLVSNALQTFQTFNFTTLPPGNSDYATITNGVFTAHSGNDTLAGSSILIDGFDSTHTDPNSGNKVFINNGGGGGLGVNNGNLDTNETVFFEFNNIVGDAARVGDQSSVTIGVGKANTANESFQITIWNDTHTINHTETITQTDGTAVIVDAAHWQGTGVNTFFSFGEVDVENLGGTAAFAASDDKILVTSISGATVIGSTTLNFTPTITDGDGDTASGSNFSVSLNSTANANGGFTLVGTTGDDVILSSSHVDTLTGNGGTNTFEFNNPSDGGGQSNGAITSTNTDTITDFNTTKDVIEVSAAGFNAAINGGLTFGEVFTSSQVVNAADNNFTNSAQRFLFDQGNNTLYYSADGTTAHEHAIAILNLVAAINPANIHVAH